MNVPPKFRRTRKLNRHAVLLSLAVLFVPQISLAQPEGQTAKRLRLIPILSDFLIQDIQESKDGSRLLTHDRGYAPRLWDPKTMRLLGFLLTKSRYAIEQATMSEDGTRVVTLAPDAINLWNTRNLRLIASWKLANPEDSFVHWTRVRLSPDNQAIIVGNRSGQVWMAKTQPQEPLVKVADHSGTIEHPVADLVFSDDGKWAASAGLSKEILVLDVAQRKVVSSIGIGSSTQWVEFSPDGSQLLATQRNGRATLWDVKTATKRHDWAHAIGERSIGNTMMASIFVGPQRDKVLVAAENGLMTLFDAKTGLEVRKLTGYSAPIREIRRARDYVTVATYAGESAFSQVEPLKIWNTETGKEYPFSRGDANPTAGEFAPDGTYFWLGYDDGAIRKHKLKDGSVATEQIGAVRSLLNVHPLGEDGRFLFEILRPIYVGKEPKVLGRQFGFDIVGEESGISPDSPLAVVALDQKNAQGEDQKIAAVANVATKAVVFGFWKDSKHYAWGKNQLIFVADSTEIHLFDMTKPAWVKGMGVAPAEIRFLKTSPNSDWLIAGTTTNVLVVTNVADPSKSWTITNDNLTRADHAAISPDGKVMAIADGSDVLIFNLADASIVSKFSFPKITIQDKSFDQLNSLTFSPDGASLFMAGFYTTLCFDVKTGTKKFETILTPDSDSLPGVEGPILSFDGRLVVSSHQNVLNVADANTGRVLARNELAGTIRAITFYNKAKRLITVDDSDQVVVWNLEKFLPPVTATDTGSLERLGSLVTMRDDSWLVIDVDGRYDATDPSNVTGASYVMEWEKGLEPLNVSQFKSAFYEPGLFEKLLGIDPEPRRAVPDLETIRLYPEVLLTQNKRRPQSIEVSVLERDNGGIGTVQVLINGKVIEERKGAGFFVVDTDKYRNYMLPAARLPEGKGNVVQVTVSNKQGDLISLPSTIDVGIPSNLATPEVKLYGLFVGVGDYVGEKRDLAAPPSDANAMAAALKLTAEKLLPGRVEITTLTSGSPLNRPNRTAILNWFDDVAKKATSSDIVFVFFAGHGTSRIGDQQGYYFLTADADPSDVQPSIIGTATLSAQDLQKGLTGIAAGKQIIVLDTCHSGAASSNLVETDRSSGPDYARAYEAIKDATGTWLLAGSAADQLSYESSNVEHGMLTYALLEGLDLASPNALREGDSDTLFVDVERWFTYAVNRVESLKNEVGIAGLQSPEFKRNKSVRSFDVGAMTRGQRGFVGLKAPKPVVILGAFGNADDEDPLKLEEMLGTALNESSSLKLWTDVTKHPNVYRLAGSYSVSGDSVTLKINVQRFDSSMRRSTIKTLDFTGKQSDIRELVKAVQAKVVQTIQELEQAKASQPTGGPPG